MGNRIDKEMENDMDYRGIYNDLRHRCWVGILQNTSGISFIMISIGFEIKGSGVPKP